MRKTKIKKQKLRQREKGEETEAEIRTEGER